MAVTVREYNTGPNWTAVQLFECLRQAFIEHGLFDDEFHPGLGITAATYRGVQASTQYLLSPNLRYPLTAYSPVTTNGDVLVLLTANSSGHLSTWGPIKPKMSTQALQTTYYSCAFVNLGSQLEITMPKYHSLKAGNDIWIDFSTSGFTDGRYFISSVTNDKIYIPWNNTGGASGNCYIYICIANYAQYGSNTVYCTTNTPHNLKNGAYVYISNRFTGSGNSSYLRSVQVTSSTQFNLDAPSSYTTNGVLCYQPCYYIPANIPQAGLYQDFVFSVTELGDSAASNTNWMINESAGVANKQYVLHHMVVDKNSTFGNQLLLICLYSSSNKYELFIRTGHAFNPSISAPEFKFFIEPHYSIGCCGIGTARTIPIATSQTDNLYITTYQSAIDPKAIFFTFTQSGVSLSAVMLHLFKLHKLAPYNLNDIMQPLFLAGYTAYVGSYSSLMVYTPIVSTSLSIEKAYTVASEVVFTTSYCSSATEAPRIWHKDVLIKGLSLNPKFIPAIHVLSNEFGLLVVAQSVVKGNIIEISPTEKYIVMLSNANTYISKTVALVAQVTSGNTTYQMPNLLIITLQNIECPECPEGEGWDFFWG